MKKTKESTRDLKNITVNGKPLSTFIDTDSEVKHFINEEIKKMNMTKGKRTEHIKIDSNAIHNTEMRFKTMSNKEINKKYYELFLRKCKCAKDVIVLLLLSGETLNSMTAHSKIEMLINDKKIDRSFNVKKNAIHDSFYKLMKSNFRKYIIREKRPVKGIINKDSIFHYKLTEEGLNLRPVDALKMSKEFEGKKKRIKKPVQRKILEPNTKSALAMEISKAVKEFKIDFLQQIPQRIKVDVNITISFKTK